MASVRCLDSALNITLTDNGRLLRNLIHGADTVMSHITHFYHLAAADFVDASPLGSPWSSGTGQAFGALISALGYIPLTTTTLSGTAVVRNYIEALDIRRRCHTMSSILAGRHPVQHALVPGGAATIFTQSDKNDFKTHLDIIRNFIDQRYIPDVVTAATLSGAANPYGVNGGITAPNYCAYWTVGTNPGWTLSYGEYPEFNEPFNNGCDRMLLARGRVSYAAPTTLATFYVGSIAEYVNYSHYKNSTNALHPSVGETETDIAKKEAGTSYSWLKAPRIMVGGNAVAHEVGPIARIMASYNATYKPTVTQIASGGLAQGVGNVWPIAKLPVGATYNVTDLVNHAIAAINGGLTAGSGVTITAANMWSPLGRHATRALETKLVADAMDSWLTSLSLNNTTNADAPVATGSGYTYVAIPKATVYGTGLAEAPRGALGHWMTIQSKKIGRYQCVVPSTWNACPRGSSYTNLGPAESVVQNLVVPAVNSALGATANDGIVNIARLLHPYDFCIACAVHVVNPEGKEIARFDMAPDGRITEIKKNE